MTKFKKLLYLIGFAGTLALPCSAQNWVTFTVTVTNTPTNGDTITVNGSTRLWTNVVANPATQILIATNNGLNATNLLNQLAGTPIAGTILTFPATNQITVSGQNLTGSATTNWETNFLSTNTITGVDAVAVPFTSAYSGTNLAYIANQLIIALNSFVTNAFSATNLALTNFANLTQNQTIGGVKTFTNVNGAVGSLTNGGWTGASLTNGQNFGNPFRSPGSGVGSEEFGLGAVAVGDETLALGDGANSGGTGGIAIGYDATNAANWGVAVGNFALAGGFYDVAFGYGTSSTGGNGVAVGVGSLNSGSLGMALGTQTTNAFARSTAVGYKAATTQADQLAVGKAGQSVWIPGGLQVDGGVSNLLHNGQEVWNGPTNLFNTAYAVLAGANSSLVNGGNNIAAPTNGYLKLSGPTGAFTIYGVSGGYEGLVLTLQNDSAQTLTLANESGSALAAGNRIKTGFSADQAYTNQPGVISLRYDGTLSRWVIQSHN